MANRTKQFNDDTVIISRQDYLNLKQEAEAYRSMVAKVFELPLRDPVEEVVADFQATGLYTDEFLADLEDGLHKSSYSKKHAHQTSKKKH